MGFQVHAVVEYQGFVYQVGTDSGRLTVTPQPLLAYLRGVTKESYSEIRVVNGREYFTEYGYRKEAPDFHDGMGQFGDPAKKQIYPTMELSLFISLLSASSS